MHVVIEVENRGRGPADLEYFQGYSVHDKQGNKLGEGVFLYAFPYRIAPREKAYFIDTVFFRDVAPEDIGRSGPTSAMKTAVPHPSDCRHRNSGSPTMTAA